MHKYSGLFLLSVCKVQHVNTPQLRGACYSHRKGAAHVTSEKYYCNWEKVISDTLQSIGHIQTRYTDHLMVGLKEVQVSPFYLLQSLGSYDETIL